MSKIEQLRAFVTEWQARQPRIAFAAGDAALFPHDLSALLDVAEAAQALAAQRTPIDGWATLEALRTAVRALEAEQ